MGQSGVTFLDMSVSRGLRHWVVLEGYSEVSIASLPRVSVAVQEPSVCVAEGLS